MTGVTDGGAALLRGPAPQREESAPTLPEIKHTPGPWYVAYAPDYDEDGWGGEFVYDLEVGVFHIHLNDPDLDDIETLVTPYEEEDARLIALAPELWALAQAVERGIREMEESDAAGPGFGRSVAMAQLDGPIKYALDKLQAAVMRLKTKPEGGI